MLRRTPITFTPNVRAMTYNFECSCGHSNVRCVVAQIFCVEVIGGTRTRSESFAWKYSIKLYNLIHYSSNSFLIELFFRFRMVNQMVYYTFQFDRNSKISIRSSIELDRFHKMYFRGVEI